MYAPETGDAVNVVLEADEALVLFELLSRWCEAGEGPTPAAECFVSTAECASLHAVLASLQKQLSAPFRADYLDHVARARECLTTRWDYPTLSG